MAVLLIAEDNEDVCMLLRRIFTRAGFTVVTAADGKEALQACVEQHPDVVLTDLDMPGLTGVELAQALRQHPAEYDVPIAILSGSLRPGDPRAAEAGLCEAMLKPFAKADLLVAVQHLVAIGRHRHGPGVAGCPLQQQAPAVTRPLAECLRTLAKTPPDAPTVDGQLTAVAQLAVDRVAVVDYASVTALRDGAYTTVAANSALARAVDEAQYADHDGPCVQAVDHGVPVVVPDVTATMIWPGFRDKALNLGLHASVSVPLLTADGASVAVLNLHGRDAAAMAPLIAAVWALYHPERPLPAPARPLDPGGAELLAGLTAALSAPPQLR